MGILSSSGVYSFDDLKLTVSYLEKHCKGAPVRLVITDENRLEVYVRNNLDEDITIRIFPTGQDGPTLFPRIIKEDRLEVK